MGIAQFEGRALVFNNGVIDVRQGDTSLVDSEKVAHIPESNVAIDNETIIRNANNQLEVPIDEDTIYMDAHGFMKAKGGSGESYTAGEHISIDSENVISAEWPEVSDHKVILCTKVGEGAAGPIGSFTLNQNSDKTITIPIPEPEAKEYQAGQHIVIDSENTISAEWPTVPTKVSELQNDLHFITSEDVPEVPTKLSELVNDVGFITSEDIPEVPEYTAGANVQITSEGVISATDTTYSAGSGIAINDNQISVNGRLLPAGGNPYYSLCIDGNYNAVWKNNPWEVIGDGWDYGNVTTSSAKDVSITEDTDYIIITATEKNSGLNYIRTYINNWAAIRSRYSFLRAIKPFCDGPYYGSVDRISINYHDADYSHSHFYDTDRSNNYGFELPTGDFKLVGDYYVYEGEGDHPWSISLPTSGNTYILKLKKSGFPDLTTNSVINWSMYALPSPVVGRFISGGAYRDFLCSYGPIGPTN